MLNCTLDHLSSYSICPKYCFFSWNNPNPISLREQVFQEIIKKQYLWHSKNHKIIPWKTLSRITQEVMLEVLYPGFDEINQSKYKEYKGYLQPINQWYYGFYLEKFAFPGLSNVPISVTLDDTFTVKDLIPIVAIGESVTLFDFIELPTSMKVTEYTPRKVFNDIKIYARSWLFWKASGLTPCKYVRILVTEKTLKVIPINLTEELIIGRVKYFRQMFRGIKDNAFYLSVSEKCNNCKYRKQCVLGE